MPLLSYGNTGVMTKSESVNKLISAIWANANYEVVPLLIDNNYTIFHDPGDSYEGKTLSNKMFIERLNIARKTFPDLNFKVLDIQESTDKVTAAWRMKGTFLGDLPQIKANGNKINVTGITIYSFNNGKISGHWQEFDRATLYAQMSAKDE